MTSTPVLTELSRGIAGKWPITTAPQPVSEKERIVSIDVLRGFALLGILPMNIQYFSMIGAAYSNPTGYGNLTGINYWIWLLSHVLADEKFMTIFSMLFGAGIVLITGRIEAAGKDCNLRVPISGFPTITNRAGDFSLSSSYAFYLVMG